MGRRPPSDAGSANKRNDTFVTIEVERKQLEEDLLRLNKNRDLLYSEISKVSNIKPKSGVVTRMKLELEQKAEDLDKQVGHLKSRLRMMMGATR